MSSLMKLLVPILLGVAAGGLNWFVMTVKTSPRSFVAVSEDVKAGERFDEEKLKKLPVSGDVASLAETAVPWEHRAVLFDRTSHRDLMKGDVVLWRDSSPPTAALAAREDELALAISLEGVGFVPRLLLVGDEVGFLIGKPGRAKLKTEPGLPERPPEDPEFEYVGPFRVLSVGERIGRKAGDEPGDGRDTDNKVITVAIQLQGPDRVPDAKTRRLLAAQQAGPESQRRVVAVVLKPSARK
ncbi:MAG: hypothetical protein JNM56_09455 [Planctomycetia bacterium]|nr:hypothetical protein [Planctomycetia bacterium]